MAFNWEDTRDVLVVLDDTMLFGKGYDFDGLEFFREEADTPHGRFAVWPEQTGPCRNWCLYGGTMGWFQQGFDTADAAKAEAERLFHNIGGNSEGEGGIEP